MDGSRFDALTRALVTSRRGVLRTLLSTGAAALTAAELGTAAQDDEQSDQFYRAGLACDAGQPCGSLAPCEFGLCTPKACLIDGIPRENLAPKPGNSCRFCAPTLESWTDWLGIVDNGEPCQSSDENPCLTPDGVCLLRERSQFRSLPGVPPARTITLMRLIAIHELSPEKPNANLKHAVASGAIAAP